MLRLACFLLLLLACAGVAWGAPVAAAGGCATLVDPAQRADCSARERARTAARAEVRRQAGAGPAAAAGGAGSPAWQRAVEEADRGDVRDVLEPRPVAAIGGLAWFALVLRARRRRAGGARRRS